MLADYEDRIRKLPSRQQAVFLRALELLAAALLEEPPKTVAAFVGDEPTSHASARARNRSRLQLLAQRIREDSVRGAELGRNLGVSRQRLQQLRDANKLLGVQPPLATEFWYPRWQFQDDGTRQPWLARLLAAGAEARLSPLQLHVLVTSPAAGVDGQPLVELLDSDPDSVLELVAGAAELGS